jgi:excisionase family DNA binding protein
MRGKDHSRVPYRLLTLRETATALGCSVKTLRRRIADRHIAVIKDGRIVRVHPEDLERYIRTRRYG